MNLAAEFHRQTVVQKYGGTSLRDAARFQAIAARLKSQHNKGLQRVAIVVSARSGVTDRLDELVRQVNPQPSGRSHDLAVTAGEQVSVALLAAALEREQVPVFPLLAFQLGVRTNALHAKARIRSIDTQKIHSAWDRGEVVVTAGFQGVTDDGTITTLGRGGSDTSAVALAAALGASYCEINTDVDGVYTADPRIVPNAQLIASLDFETALEMASLGSKVLHPRSVELAAKFNIPLVVRNSFHKEDHQRTHIMPIDQMKDLEAPVVSGVSLDQEISRITLSDTSARSELISEVFARLHRSEVNIDVIVHNLPQEKSSARGLSVGFTVAGADLKQAERALGELAASGFSGLNIETESGLEKVSVVGVGMASHPGVAARTFSCLQQAGVRIKMISTSEIKISCVVERGEGSKACEALHREFLENV